MNRFLLCAFLLGSCQTGDRRQNGCEDMESSYEAEARHRLDTLDDKVYVINERLEHLDRCIMMKMSMAEDLFQVRVGIQTCIASMRNIVGRTP